MTDFSGKTVIVTGASRGIGAAIAKRFLSDGARVLLASRSRPGVLDDNAFANRVFWRQTDVGDSKEVKALFAELDNLNNGSVDVLINNAGVQMDKTVDETTDEELASLNRVNIDGAFYCAREAVKRMRGQGHGVIVNLGSIAGETADYGLAAYCASKAWVHGLTKAIAADHGRHGIRCNAACPTWTRTEMSTEFFDSTNDAKAAEEGVARRHPLKRIGEPKDIANVCAWLASDDASYINGQLMMVDGGLTSASAIDPEIDIYQT